MQDEKSLGASDAVDENVEQGRSELLPEGMTRRSAADALKESDLSDEQLQATVPQTDPLAAASNETVAAIREAVAAEGAGFQTMPAAGRMDVSDEELERRAARRKTIEAGAMDGSAHGESFGGEVVSVEESRRRLLRGQLPEGIDEFVAAQGGNVDFAVRDVNTARMHAMRLMARAAAAPSGEAINGRVRSGDGGDALRNPVTGAGGGSAAGGGAGGASETGGAGNVTLPAGGTTLNPPPAGAGTGAGTPASRTGGTGGAQT